MQCTAKCKATGQQCNRRSIAGKDKCQVHGGVTPVKHGRYSKYNPAIVQIVKEYKEFRKLDIKTPDDELALTCALLNHRLKQMGENPSGKDIDGLLTYLDRIESLIITKSKIKVDDTVTNAVEDVTEHFTRFCNFVVHRLKTPELIKEFMVAANDFFEQEKAKHGLGG